MAGSSHSELPPALTRLLADEELGRAEAPAFELLTQGEGGWPHVALLSAGELVAVSATELRIALHAGSRTTANVRRERRALLHAVVPAGTWTVRLDASWIADQEVGGVELACFSCRALEVAEHRAPYAEIVTGITFALTDPSAPDRWRDTRALLRRL